jgi:hypothetical protein
MTNIKINDFDVFNESIKAVSKIVQSCKMTIDQDGLTIYSQNNFARSELTTDAIYSEKAIEICIRDLSMLLKIMKLIKDQHDNDYTKLKITFEEPFIKFSSNKMDAKLSTIKEHVIQNFISKKVQTVLIPVFEFKTSSENIKMINSYQFIFPDIDSGRIYIKTDENMEKNVVYAELNNRINDFSNAVTMKFGDVIIGKIDKDIIIDFERLMLFNIVDSNDIVIKLMDKNVLVSEINNKTDNAYMFMKIYNSMRRS